SLFRKKQAIERGVFLRTPAPGKIGLHALPLQGLPDLRVSMKIYHPSDGVQERVAAVRCKLQSGGNPGRDRSLVGVDDRIRKPPGARHDGHAAVAQPIELRQSTWLEPRGNKDCIAAALHQM